MHVDSTQVPPHRLEARRHAPGRGRRLDDVRSAAAAGAGCDAAPRSSSARPHSFAAGTATYVPEGRLYVVNAERPPLRRSPRSARTSAAASRSATAPAGSSARAMGRSTTSPASRSRARRRGGMDRYHCPWTAARSSSTRRRPPTGPDRGAKQFLTPPPRARACTRGELTCPTNVLRLRRSNPTGSTAASIAISPPGLVFMVVLIAGFVVYECESRPCVDTPPPRRPRRTPEIGSQLFKTDCSSCHGKGANGGSAPMLNSQQFLKSTSDDQIAPGGRRRVGHRDAGMEPRLRWHAHRRADPADRHLPALIGAERSERSRLACRQGRIGQPRRRQGSRRRQPGDRTHAQTVIELRVLPMTSPVWRSNGDQRP